MIAAVLVLPEGDRRAHERTRDLRSVAGPGTLLVVYDGGPTCGRSWWVGGPTTPSNDGVATGLVPRLMTEVKRHRRTALERLLSAHLLVDVLAWESGYVLLDPSGRVVMESALQSGEPWCGGLTGLRGADLVLPGDVGRFEAVRRAGPAGPVRGPHGGGRGGVARARSPVARGDAGQRRLGLAPRRCGGYPSGRDGTTVGRAGPAVPAPPGVAPAAPVLELLAEGVAIYGPDGTIRGGTARRPACSGPRRPRRWGRTCSPSYPTSRRPSRNGTGDPDVWSDEVRTVLPDGSEQVLERRFTRLRGEDGVLSETVLVVSSGTESREAAAVAQRFAAILDSSTEAILSKTTDGVITTWNDGGGEDVRLSGRGGRSAATSRSWSPRSAGPSSITIMHRVMSGSMVERLETVRRRKDGTEARVILNVVAPLRRRGRRGGGDHGGHRRHRTAGRRGRPRGGRGPIRRRVPALGVRDGHGRPGGSHDHGQPGPRRAAGPDAPGAGRPPAVRLRGARDGDARRRCDPVVARRLPTPTPTSAAISARTARWCGSRPTSPSSADRPRSRST